MASDKPAKRRTYTEALKAQVLAECAAPGTSVAKVSVGSYVPKADVQFQG
ncbi:MAG: hypothetical protein IV092_26410 [Burkholderiaceae bacterium]|nr:hypothetical protein [Burkholderiaceae bacterium]